MRSQKLLYFSYKHFFTEDIIMAKRKIAIPESIDEKIATAEAELANLLAQVKAKKAEIKKLAKAKEAELKAAAEKKAAEEKENLMQAVADSGKTVEEIMEFLKK